MVSSLYNGPIIDAHHHLWDLGMDRHPWLRPDGAFGPRGTFDSLKGHSYTLQDYANDVANEPVLASVHIEALWDPSDSPVNETRWLESLDKSGGVAVRYVAGARFQDQDAKAIIREQAQFSRVKGIRQTIAWTPDPTKRMVASGDISDTAAFRAATEVVAELGLALELLLYPDQAVNVTRLADAFPELTIVVNHIASPIDVSPEGLKRWRDAVSRMADTARVMVKVSDVAIYLAHPTVEGVRFFTDHLFRTFGPDRLMVGSDAPVGKIPGWTVAEQFDVYRQVFSDLTASQQEAVFCLNAAQVYGIDLLNPTS